MDSDSENDRLLKPSSVDEVVKLVCAAKADGHQLRIRGVMSGERKTTPGVQDVLLDQMCDVVEYPARDMTITVQAGMPMLELTKILAEENQQLPIDAFADFSSIIS